MRITVMLGFWLGGKTQARKRVLEVDEGTTLGQLLRMLAETWDSDIANAIPKTGEHPAVLVLRNDEAVLDMSQRLADGDTIDFAIPLSGG